MSEKQNENELLNMTIEGPLSDTNLVQKSNPLFDLWKSPLTLSEFKILDTYLSRINSRDPDSRTVVFEKGELEKLLGVERIRQPELDKRLEHLQRTILNIGEGRNIDKITLFERSQAIQDDYGTWKVCLTASQSAMKYIFNIEKLGYFRYQIRNIVKLKSLNSYILLLYFEHSLYGRNHAQLRIGVEELKQMLGCTEPSYNDYKYFNQRVLQRCNKEINEKTDISFTYSTIRKNRKVAIIVFDIHKTARIECLEDFPELQIPSLSPDEQSETSKPESEKVKLPSRPSLPPVRTVAINGNKLIFDILEKNEFAARNQKYFEMICQDERLRFYGMYCGYEFLPEEMQKICELLFTIDVPQVDFPDRLGIEPTEQREYEFADFLDNMYGKFYSYAQWRKMTRKQRFNYFYKSLENYRKEHALP